MSNWLGAVIGGAIDRRDGDSGIKGAILGSVAERVLKAAVPVVALGAIGWLAIRAARKAMRGPDASEV